MHSYFLLLLTLTLINLFTDITDLRRTTAGATHTLPISNATYYTVHRDE
jgi:hypothetical protein